MTLIVYIRDLIISLLNNLGFSVALTNLLANISLTAIAFGLLIAFPHVVLAVIGILLLLTLKR